MTTASSGRPEPASTARGVGAGMRAYRRQWGPVARRGVRFVLRHLDAKFCPAFDDLFRSQGAAMLEARGMTVESLPTGQAVRRYAELPPARTAAACT